MDTVIGLGTAGCNIATVFQKYPQYDVYKIDAGIEGEKCFDIGEKNSPEDYERSCPDLSPFLRHITGDVLFIVAGGGYSSGASLQILQTISGRCNINVLYIKPNEDDLNRTAILQNRLTYNVFQQYARSGLFKTLYIVSNDSLEEIIGDLPIFTRNDKLNEFLVGIVHYINVFNNTEPIVDNSETPKENARIATFGVYDMQNEIDTPLFDIENICDKKYYYGISETVLKTDGKLLKKIREHMSSDEYNISYEIHSTKHDKSFCYFIAYSKFIQPLDKL